MPTAGAGEIVVKNAAVAIAPLDTHMQDVGVFVQQWPTVFGCDVAGEVYEVGEGVERFTKGDRVIGHTINLVTGWPSDGAYQLYSTVPADKAAILPDRISFTDGVVVPFAFEAAICALCLKEPGIAVPGVPTPALNLPYPSLEQVPSLKRVLVVYGGSSSVGSMVTQIATDAGIIVISIAGKHNHDLVKCCGAVEVFDYEDSSAVVGNIVSAVNKAQEAGSEFIGVFDAISTLETYKHDLSVLEKLGGGHFACVHPPPAGGVPANIKAGMIFAVNDIATPVWRDFVTPALESGKLQCLPPPTVVGKGLQYVQVALEQSKKGVSGTKLVVEL